MSHLVLRGLCGKCGTPVIEYKDVANCHCLNCGYSASNIIVEKSDYTKVVVDGINSIVENYFDDEIASRKLNILNENKPLITMVSSYIYGEQEPQGIDRITEGLGILINYRNYLDNMLIKSLLPLLDSSQTPKMLEDKIFATQTLEITYRRLNGFIFLSRFYPIIQVEIDDTHLSIMKNYINELKKLNREFKDTSELDLKLNQCIYARVTFRPYFGKNFNKNLISPDNSHPIYQNVGIYNIFKLSNTIDNLIDKCKNVKDSSLSW